MPEQQRPVPQVTTMTAADEPAVTALLHRVPRGEYLFLKEEVDDPSVIHAWRERRGGVILLARVETEVDAELVGMLAVVPGLGWSRHVGELRLVVDPAHRGRGIGAALARAGLAAAVSQGLEKVSVEVVADQEAVASLFRDLGFVPEAQLADHIRDGDGQLHDLLVLAHPVESSWSSLTAMGITEGWTVA